MAKEAEPDLWDSLFYYIIGNCSMFSILARSEFLGGNSKHTYRLHAREH